MTTQAPDLNSPAAARAGIAAGVLAYIIWGLMPIYWRLLGEASSLEILCLRIIGSLVFIFGYLAAKAGSVSFPVWSGDFARIGRSPSFSSGPRFSQARTGS